jgi:hypothetical protein
VDLIEFRLKFTVAILLVLLWVMLLLFPLLVAASPPLWLWCFFGALFAYSLYTGIRAWHRGWTSRFILRVVIPLALLTLSCIVAGTWRLLG